MKLVLLWRANSPAVMRVFREQMRQAMNEPWRTLLIDRLLIGILCEGHLLLEGVPGLAKTLTVKTLASAIQTAFQRIQFTPDLMPSDLLGTMIFDQKRGRQGLSRHSGNDNFHRYIYFDHQLDRRRNLRSTGPTGEILACFS